MDKEDIGTPTLLELHARRKLVVRLHRKGMGIMQVAELAGLSWPAARAALKLYEEGGWAALQPRARGKQTGNGRILTPEQEREIRTIICDKRPEQMKLDFALWNRGAVTILIERETGIKLCIRAVGNYLKRWGMTPQKPIKRAYEQKPEAVQAWLDSQYPAIEARAKAEGGEIQWGDETAVVNTDVRGRSYSPRGETPVAFAVGGTRHKLSMISTVTNRGQARWMIIDENFNADNLITFMHALTCDTPKKIFLILDNLRVHHSRVVKAWLEENKAKIEVFYLPSYSPQLNPDERLNADLKQALGSTVAMRTRAALRNATSEYMTMLATSPERVMSYFQDPRVQYAA